MTAPTARSYTGLRSRDQLVMSRRWYKVRMAQRSTFLVHVTSDDLVWIEVVATGEVIRVANLNLIGPAIERWISAGEHRAPGQDAGMEG